MRGDRGDRSLFDLFTDIFTGRPGRHRCTTDAVLSHTPMMVAVAPGAPECKADGNLSGVLIGTVTPQGLPSWTST